MGTDSTTTSTAATGADPIAAPSRVIDPNATEEEIDLTANPVTWTAPPPKSAAKPAAATKPPKQRSIGAIVGPLFGALALLLVILLIALVAVLFNRVSDLEDQVGGAGGSTGGAATAASIRPVQRQVDELENQLTDLKAQADALNAAQPGDATDGDLAALTARLDATIACINTYMDTVANAENANASYTYIAC
jgi:hypothetical protein